MNNAPAILIGAITWTAALASLATLFQLFKRHINGQQLLPYERRRPVPWTFVAPAIAMAPALMTLLFRPGEETYEIDPVDSAALAAQWAAGMAGGDPTASYAGCVMYASALSVRDRVSEMAAAPTMIWAQLGEFIVFAAICQVFVAAAFRATTIDLGWPQSWGQFGRDVKIGAIAFLAILLPVYLIQLILTVILEPEQIHPLIEKLEMDYTPQMMVAAIAAVIVGAPLFEETAFRLILQGWLERREDVALGWRKSVEGAKVGPIGAPPPRDDDHQGELGSVPISVVNDPLPPAMGVLPGLPYGWAPVLASGAIFALAHLGHGVAPVSLFPLGVTLGYIYQRTHRIVPSMVCHGLFNGFSILMLWLQLASAPGTPGQ